MFKRNLPTTPEQYKAMGWYGVLNDVIAEAVGQTAFALARGNSVPVGAWQDDYRGSTFMFDATDDNKYMAWALSKVRADEAAKTYGIVSHDQHRLQAIKAPFDVISIGFGGDWSRARPQLPGQRFREASRLALFARALGHSATDEREAHTVVLPFSRTDLERWPWPSGKELAGMARWTGMLNQSVARNSVRRAKR